ncbi:ParB/RepB/Spo0J family partition protein [Effusibacillus lacus]|uniref:Stage 0 sporulation protein J n=1 Tax=Effusibacillus lacus TaxID=1348429 RepID=A0A292YCH4_9BACL|nr:ParB/RepB/Spo0J family partition protein [Effusibacillus lacus]TCS75187.1 ParB family chromosome partitioning protein [Effusibacillus lacus]GAX89132.1 stage 0 sporulation protein J [Effusibacillus lacus]
MSKRLGKGLEALLPQIGADDSIVTAKVEDLRPNPYQPRREFNEDKLQELADSIKEHGIIQPIIVRKSFRGYEIVAGERRWRAAQMVGLEEVPVVVKDFDDRQMTEIALIENLQREDLNPIEIAEAYSSIMEKFELTQDELAKKVGQSRSHVANFLRLLNLPKEIRDYVSRGTISMGHARAILGLEDTKQQLALARKIMDEELSVRAVEQLVNRLTRNVPRETKKQKPEGNRIIQQYEEKFRSCLGTSVKIHSGKKRGKIEIEYYSMDDLERILGLLGE